MRFLRHADRWTGDIIEWVDACDWCAARERRQRVEVEALEELWRARECALPGCSVVFTPSGQSRQKYCSDAHRKRAHRLLKARLGSA
jgi:hypothetical protein